MFATLFFFFNATATTEIYTLSLHDALPILQFLCTAGGAWPEVLLRERLVRVQDSSCFPERALPPPPWFLRGRDRKSTRLNSSHVSISYAVFCLKKKKKREPTLTKSTISNVQ